MARVVVVARAVVARTVGAREVRARVVGQDLCGGLLGLRLFLGSGLGLRLRLGLRRLRLSGRLVLLLSLSLRLGGLLGARQQPSILCNWRDGQRERQGKRAEVAEGEPDRNRPNLRSEGLHNHNGRRWPAGPSSVRHTGVSTRAEKGPGLSGYFCFAIMTGMRLFVAVRRM